MTASSRPDGWGFGSLRAAYFGPLDPDLIEADPFLAADAEDGAAEVTVDISGYLRFDMENHEVVVEVSLFGLRTSETHELRFPISAPSGMETVWDITARHY